MNAVVQIDKIISRGNVHKYGCSVSINGMPPVYKEVPVSKFLEGKWLYEIPGFALTGGKKSKEAISDYLNHRRVHSPMLAS